MAERWKPKDREEYFYVDNDCAYPSRDTWTNDRIDERRWKNGNCFKTKEEAEYAANKVRDLLLSLHCGVATSILGLCGVAEMHKDIEKQLVETEILMSLWRDFVKPFKKEKNCKTSKKENTLPKLTAEVFNRPDCPEWAKWAIISPGGYIVFFKEKPEVYENGLILKGDYVYIWTKKYSTENWQNSLVERPAKDAFAKLLKNCAAQQVNAILQKAKDRNLSEQYWGLPDWCKVGQWVYLDDYETESRYYVKITERGDNYIRGVSENTEFYTDFHFELLKPARLRPYNAEDMKALMGKVISNGPGMHIVTGFENVFGDACMVHVNGHLFSAKDLLRRFTIDGNPCGVLEHLENGEWVK